MSTNVSPSFEAVAAANQDLELVKREEVAPENSVHAAAAVAAVDAVEALNKRETEVDQLPASDVQLPPSDAHATISDAQGPSSDAQLPVASSNSVKAAEDQDLGDPIDEIAPMDVLSGRGASVNNHPGNKKFRALCFVRKPLFDAGNHAAKRRIATEIVHLMMKPQDANVDPSRFLKRKDDKSPHYAMTEEQAIAKAQQVMRDYKRPDRVALRENLEASGQLRKRNRTTVSTPIDEVKRDMDSGRVILKSHLKRSSLSLQLLLFSLFILLQPMLEVPAEPIVENPFGVHAHDVLCGRGAYVNGHVGNARLRELALDRKKAFDHGNYTDKRHLAMDMVQMIHQLDPPGRFLKKASSDRIKAEEETAEEEQNEDADVATPGLIDGIWEELTDEKAIHKACQVMRDIDRPDRKHREERKEERKRRKLAKANDLPPEPDIKTEVVKEEQEGEVKDVDGKDSLSTLAEKAAVEVVDNALKGAETVAI
jgi:hypothetical protein